MTTPAHLRQFILSNLGARRWRAGDRLPPERELCQQFGIGRGGVRRVLQEFKQLGAITQTVGSGTYVTERAPSVAQALSAGDPYRQTSPSELMEARLALEPAIVEMVIANATPADFEHMEACCERAEAATSLEDFEHWDGMLHEAIAAAAHNSFVANVFRMMNDVRNQGEWGMLKKRSVTPQRRLQYQAEHRKLVQAIKRRDGAEACAMTLDHLLHVQRNLLAR